MLQTTNSKGSNAQVKSFHSEARESEWVSQDKIPKDKNITTKKWTLNLRIVSPTELNFLEQ